LEKVYILDFLDPSLREKTKYVLGLPGATQIGLEHGKK
jgi:hypothetical protein